MKKIDTNNKTTKSKIILPRKIHKIDADGQILGRLAVKISILLQGKHKPDFFPHLDNGDSVEVNNAVGIKTTGRKMEQKLYYHHSGYPGGLKEKTMIEIFKKNPGELLKKAVWNMLPKNKLRDKRIKRLKITN